MFGRPYIGDAEIEEVVSTLRSGWLGTGPRVAAFEDSFRAYKDVPHALALNSCTAALHIALLACGIGEGDEVITTPLTFAATTNAIIHAGAVPVLVDVDPSTMNLTPEAVAEAVTERTRAILPVHFAGRPCNMNGFSALARRYDLQLIEDCAHAVEAHYKGRPVGTFGNAGCFSFYVTKNVITGEGGMLVTPHADVADRARVLSLHGMTRDAWRRFSDAGYRHYQVVAPGFKYNMMDLQAAIGLHQLARVETQLKRRTAIWERYDQAFQDLPCVTPAIPEDGTRHARHLYTILIDPDALGTARDAVLHRMAERNVGVGVHYLPIHTHPYYADRFGYRRGDFPCAEHIGDRTMSIPLSAQLSDDDVGDVIAAVRGSLDA